MSGGGIIIQRRSVLLPAATNSSIYDSLSAAAKAKVDKVEAKAPADTTAADILTLAHAIMEAAKT
jgi:hypothetical protein